MTATEAQERCATAGEFVLGTLVDAERIVFKRELAVDRELQAEVYRWQDRLLGFAGHAQPVDPAPELWLRIQGRVNALAARPRQQKRGARPKLARRPWWERVRVLQGFSAIGAAAALVSALLLALHNERGGNAAARYVAVLQAPDTKAVGWIVDITAGERVRLIPVSDTTMPPAGRALQFWTKPQGAAGPTSLGLVPASSVTVLPAAKLPALGERQLFELTLEPATGSPLGRPSGPVLYVGSTVRL